MKINFESLGSYILSGLVLAFAVWGAIILINMFGVNFIPILFFLLFVCFVSNSAIRSEIHDMKHVILTILLTIVPPENIKVEKKKDEPRSK